MGLGVGAVGIVFHPAGGKIIVKEKEGGLSIGGWDRRFRLEG